MTMRALTPKLQASDIDDAVSDSRGPRDIEYGLREFAVKDPNGYYLSYGQPIGSGETGGEAARS